jgi:hypothetical protein
MVPLFTGAPVTWRSGYLLEWAGDSLGPETPYWGVRTGRYAYFELATGEAELYDLASDPAQLINRCPGNPPACAAAYAGIRSQLAAQLAALKE